MGFFSNLISIKLGETFDIQNGIDVIKKEVLKHHSFEFLNIPMFVTKEFMDVIKGRKVLMSHYNRDELPPEYALSYKESGGAIRVSHFGRAAEMGIINFGMRGSFNIVYGESEIYDISNISVTKCLNCIKTLHHHFFEHDTTYHFGDIFTVEEGVFALRKKLGEASNVIISNVPDFFLSPLFEIIIGGHFESVKLMLPENSKLKNKAREVKHSRILPHFINKKIIYHGKEVEPLGIAMDDTYFGVLWKEEEVLDIRSVELEKCTKCMFNLYNAEWMLSKRNS